MPRQFAFAALALLLLVFPAHADDDAAKGIAVRVVSIKAAGKLKDGKPSIEDSLSLYAKLLAPLGYDRYRKLAAELHTAKPGAVLMFRKLPLRHHADIRWKTDAKGKLLLTIAITKPNPKKKDKRLKVLDLEVASPSGQHFVVKIEHAFPDGDMLLLVTAQAQEVE